MDDLIGRIDGLLDDDESLDDWAYPWTDSMRWAPEGVWEDQADEPLDSGWDYYPDCQIHVIPVEQVAEWTRCLETLPPAERGDIDWYVVCHEHKVAGERDVPCGCGNPSSARHSR